MTVKKLETAHLWHFSSTNDFHELKQNKTESLLCAVLYNKELWPKIFAPGAGNTSTLSNV